MIVGAREFNRARITVQASGGHSGTTSERGPSAVEKAARLVRQLGEAQLPQILEPEFPLPPRLTVTAIHGGVGFSTIPDRCDISVDVRLTPRFGEDEAGRLLQDIVAAVDDEQSPRLPTVTEPTVSWPAYRLPDSSAIARALLAAAQAESGGSVAAGVCGPSNTGNLFAARGIPATCAFGVAFANVHSANEGATLADIDAIYKTYRTALTALLSTSEPGLIVEPLMP